MIHLKIDVGANGIVIRDDREFETIKDVARRLAEIRRAFPDAALTVWEIPPGRPTTMVDITPYLK